MTSPRLFSRGVVLIGLLGLLCVGIAAVVYVVAPPAGGFRQALARRATAALSRFQPPPPPPPSSVTIGVDASQVTRPISPLIYGVSVANPANLSTLGARLNRWGGNPNTRYNWELGGAWNAARDWEFRNYGQTAEAKAKGSNSDRFVMDNRVLGVETELTVPAIGWVARSGDNATRSLDVPAVGGPPLGVLTQAIAGYDPTDNRTRTSLPSSARKGAPFADPPDTTDGHVYQDEWVNHLVDHFGTAASGGVGYYAIDNEPDLWSATHTDVHPVQMSYDDTLTTFLEYAQAIKAVDPSANVLGPVLSGWTGYFYSARDSGTDNFRTHADRKAHADMPLLAWWLDQVHQHDQQTGVRTLDVLDVHYYPQAHGVYGADDDVQTRGLRLRSTRSLWDPTYVDESWINEPVRLIPRLRDWVDQYYPGTRLAIGEWNWGAEEHVSGALSTADVLGIFGREGVDMAAYWTFPPADSPAAQAFALYTDYDQLGNGFGDRAVVTQVDVSPDDVTAYASLDSTSGDVIVIAINKRADRSLPAVFRVAGIVPRNAHVYRYSGLSPTIQSLGIRGVAGSDVSVDLPAESITLVRIGRV